MRVLKLPFNHNGFFRTDSFALFASGAPGFVWGAGETAYSVVDYFEYFPGTTSRAFAAACTVVGKKVYFHP